MTEPEQTPPRYHANVMRAHGGPYDVTLDFGFRPEQTSDPTYEARISMSWEHAMSVVRILERLINDYEKQIPSLGAMRVKLAQAEAEARAAQEARAAEKERS